MMKDIAEDYFATKDGFFTKRNVRFRPMKHIQGHYPRPDSGTSVIDVIAFPRSHENTAFVVNCNELNEHLDVERLRAELSHANLHETESVVSEQGLCAHLRELCNKKWTKAFVLTLRKVLNVEASMIIDYTLFCNTRTRESDLETDAGLPELKHLLATYFASIDPLVEFRFSLRTIDFYLREMTHRITIKATPSVENTPLGRALQLLLASGHKIVTDSQLSHSSLRDLLCSECGVSVQSSRKYYACDVDWVDEKYCLCESCHETRSETNRPSCPACGGLLDRYKGLVGPGS